MALLNIELRVCFSSSLIRNLGADLTVSSFLGIVLAVVRTSLGAIRKPELNISWTMFGD